MNFCPHCGGDLRSGGRLDPIERPPAVSELLTPITETTRADFPAGEIGDAAWARLQKERAETHREKRLEHAWRAWSAEHGNFVVGESSWPPDDELLAWFEASAHADGAANATALKAWREAHPDAARTPSDPELVAWLRERRQQEMPK